MWHFLLWLHKSLQGENRVTSSPGIIHRLDWLPWTRADGIDTGCKPVPINHGRRCKLHRGCFSDLTSSVFVWYQHGDRRVGSVSQVSFPECECLALHMSHRNEVSHVGFPWGELPSGHFISGAHGLQRVLFCADFHESHARSSQAAFVLTVPPNVSLCRKRCCLDSNSHFLKAGTKLCCSGLLSRSRCLSPLAIHRT